MEGMLTFTGIVIIVFGILQIILFFKIWGMTNNVDRIWKKINTPEARCRAKLSYLQGNIEETEKLLHEAFLKEVVELSQATEHWGEWEAGYNYLEEKYEKAFKKSTNQFLTFKNIEILKFILYRL